MHQSQELTHSRVNAKGMLLCQVFVDIMSISAWVTVTLIVFTSIGSKHFGMHKLRNGCDLSAFGEISSHPILHVQYDLLIGNYITLIK